LGAEFEREDGLGEWGDALWAAANLGEVPCGVVRVEPGRSVCGDTLSNGVGQLDPYSAHQVVSRDRRRPVTGQMSAASIR